MSRPNIELLRAKLALMSPDECPPVVLAAARENFPNAPSMLWVVPVPAAGGSKNSRSSSVSVLSVGRNTPTSPMAVDADPTLPAPPTVAREDTVADLPAAHPPPPAELNDQARGANASITVNFGGLFDGGFDGSAESSAANNARLNARDFAINAQVKAQASTNNAQLNTQSSSSNSHGSASNAQLNPRAVPTAVDAKIPYKDKGQPSPEFIAKLCKGITVPGPVVPKGSKVRTRPPHDGGYYTDAEEEGYYARVKRVHGDNNNTAGYSKPSSVDEDEGDKSGHMIGMDGMNNAKGKGKSAQGSAKKFKESGRSEVIVISDSGDDEVEIVDAIEKFKPRHVVVDSVGWVFREVVTVEKAVKRCAQVMPPIDAGNGVRIYVNDPAHDFMLRAFRRQIPFAHIREGLGGASRSKKLIRHERELLQEWRERKGYIRSIDDVKWDFSPLWYLLRGKIETLKEQEKEIRCLQERGIDRRRGAAGVGGSRGGGGAGEDALARAQHEKPRLSESDLARLLFDDDE